MAGEVLDPVIGIAELGVPDQLRAQFHRVVVIVRNIDERERLVGAAERHAELVDRGSVLLFGNPRDVRVAIGPVAKPLQQRGGGPSGDDRLMTTPAAATAPTCAHNWGNFNGALFRLVSEAQRIRLAHLFDPLLAVHMSVVDPLPHQITGVYEAMLPRQPLGFLLADDPGAGKTIMAGLLIKALIASGDLERCLIVCPGSLAEQWQDELYRRFQLPFEILTNDKLEAARTRNWFLETDLVIARLDKLSRDEDVQQKLQAPDSTGSRYFRSGSPTPCRTGSPTRKPTSIQPSPTTCARSSTARRRSPTPSGRARSVSRGRSCSAGSPRRPRRSTSRCGGGASG